MYRRSDKMEKDVLRQGDILSEIPILGALNVHSLLWTRDSSGEVVSWSVPQRPVVADAAVLSHSCEIDQLNTTKVTGVILAPIRDVNKATSSDKISLLIESNKITESTRQSFLKYFYLDPLTELQYSNGAIVDFSKLFSVRNKSYDYLLNRKIAQLEDAAVEALSLKLALYVHRSERPVSSAAQSDNPA